MKILVTGSSGFIGYHLIKNLISIGYEVVGIDDHNDSYDPKLKKRRNELLRSDLFTFYQTSIHDLDDISNEFDVAINLAAQAGVRYSIENPEVYLNSNIIGTFNIIEIAKRIKTKHLIIGSSSSVYGANKKMPFKEIDKTDHQISFYAATKKSTENLAHTYSTLWKLPTTVLRFFTVYGPWGRPDMAMYIFADKIRSGEKIPVFNHGQMQRDFTYIDDIVSGIRSSIEKNYHCEIFNLGNNCCENLMDMVDHIEKALGKKAEVKYMDIQPGDVEKTFADIGHTKDKLSYEPKVSIKDGVPKFIQWYKKYHMI